MDRSINANMMTLFDITDVLNGKDKCPTIERLYFLDARETSTMPRKQFPCYICDAVKDKNGTVKYITLGIVQWVLGGPQIVKVQVTTEKLNIQYRLWDRAPSENLIALSPFPKQTAVNKKEEKLKKSISASAEASGETGEQNEEESGESGT